MKKNQQEVDLSSSVYCKGSHYSYAGTHLILELWQAESLTSLEVVESALREAIKSAGATLREIYLHHFSPFQGISGIAVIEESHISIHTWPELGYAAIDVFMCGKTEPAKTIPVFKAYFKPKKVQVLEFKRGIFENAEMVL